MKRKNTSFRSLLRSIVELHEGRLQDLIEQLEGGARLSQWTQQMSNEFAAGSEARRALAPGKAARS